MKRAVRFTVLALAAAIVAACGNQSAQTGNAPPLAYAPADTPYAFANLEPQPQAMIDWSSHYMQTIWPTIIDMYGQMLQDDSLGKAKLGERSRKILGAVLEELRAHDTLDKLREIGFKPDGRMALYGVGLIPVARIELSDPAAFKAMIARIETKVGEKIATGKSGDQEYWKFGDGDIEVAIAVEGSQLVATLWKPGTDDTVKQLLLGLKKPDKNLLDAGVLQAIAKKYTFSPYGEGYVDIAAIVQRASSAPTGVDLTIAKAMGLPTTAIETDPVCIAETKALAQKVPRVVVGAEAYAPPQLRVAMQIETDPALAQGLMAALAPAPGTGAPAEGLFDLSIATPLNKLREFALKQTDAAIASPFACPNFAKFNDGIAQLKEKLEAMPITPPFSDVTGVRWTLDKVEPRADDSMPDLATRLLIGSNNPLAALGMAQLALPQLKELALKPDGKPVALPADLLPAGVTLPPQWVAMTDKAIAITVGQGEDATLGAYFAAAPAATPVFLRSHFSGALYGLLGTYFDTIQSRLPAGRKGLLAAEKKLFSSYAKMIRSAEFTLEANPNGIGFRETVNLGD